MVDIIDLLLCDAVVNRVVVFKIFSLCDLELLRITPEDLANICFVSDE